MAVSILSNLVFIWKEFFSNMFNRNGNLKIFASNNTECACFKPIPGFNLTGCDSWQGFKFPWLNYFLLWAYLHLNFVLRIISQMFVYLKHILLSILFYSLEGEPNVLNQHCIGYFPHKHCLLGADYMENFAPGWNFISPCWDEISLPLIGNFQLL